MKGREDSEQNEDLDYPKVREFKDFIQKIGEERYAFPSTSDATSVYNPPADPVMGPSVYPPTRGIVQNAYTPSYQFPYGSSNFKGEFGRYYNSQWTLPPALLSIGAMLVLPSDPGLWPDVISRWESITINRLNDTTWSENKAKLTFVENLLGENEKKMWQQWRITYPEAYTSLEAMADNPQNITSQIRQIILMEDPYRGSTEEQDKAYRDLERINCADTKDLWKFINEFRILASKSGRLFFPATTDKFFTKLPPVFEYAYLNLLYLQLKDHRNPLSVIV